MNSFITVVVAGVAVFLAFPFRRASSTTTASLNRTIRPITLRRRHSLTASQQFEFLWAVRAEFASGASLEGAFTSGVMCLPEELLRHTRIAISGNLGISEGLKLDAAEQRLAVIGDLAQIVEITQRTGSPVNSAIERLITNVRSRQVHEQLVREELASTKATVAVLAALPLFGLLFASAFGISIVHFFTATKYGIDCAVGAFALEIIGLLWVRSLLNRARNA